MTSLVALNRKKGALKAQLTRQESCMTDEKSEWTKVKLELKLKNLDKLLCTLDTLRTEFYEAVPETEDIADIEAEFVEIQERIEMLEVSFKQLFNDCDDDCNNKTESKQKLNACNIKLPEIVLPQFTGKYEDWYTFKTEFDNIITNNSQLNEVQKLHYLHSALKDEAKLLQTPEDSFDSLLNALKNRFENKRILVNLHVKAILEFEKIMHESSKELRRLIDIVHKNIRALNNLGFERNNFSDVLISTIILEKLDKDTRKQFELSINSTEVVKLDDLITFLEKRSQSFESINKNTTVKLKSNHEQNKNLFVKSNNSDKNCVLCNVPHSLYKCSKFLEMSFPAKFSVIKRYNLCLRCFSKTHLLSQCKSHYFCTICHSYKHNTLLHKSKEQFPVSSASENPTTDTLAPSERKNDSVSLNEKISLASNCLFASSKSVILPSAIVMIRSHDGKFIEANDFLIRAAK